MQGSPIGTWFNAIGLHYCADDNTYTEYTYARQALACPVNLKCRLTSHRPYTAEELMEMLFAV